MKKVLVVDDDKELLLGIEESLKLKSFNVLTLSEGEKIFNAVESFNPDIILLDVYVGKTYGVNVCIELRKNEKTSNIPIILLSGFSKSDVLKKCPADGLIQKPFNINSLAETIQQQLI